MAMDMSPAASAPDNPAPDADHFGDCDLPWAFGCTSVAACSATATPAVASVSGHPPLLHIAIATVVPRMPTSLATAPELPPPRA